MLNIRALHRGLAMVWVVLSLIAGVTSAAAQNTLINIATAGKQGIYYPAGGAICRLINAGRFEHGIRCVTQSTQGSIANLRGLRNGLYDFALVQSDWHYHAHKGSDVFEENGRDLELRSVFSLHGEAFTVVARREADIQSFSDLKGKRVNVGPPGSGHRATLNVVLDAEGMSESDFALAAELTSSEQANALCDGTLDAVVYLVGHPNRSIEEMTHACDAVLLPVTGAPVEALLEKHPYYKATTIPGGLYPGNPDPVKTFGLGATVVTSVRTDPRIVYEVVKAVFENYEKFKGMHPALATLDRQRMKHELLSAPLHIGAIRYFRQHPDL